MLSHILKTDLHKSLANRILFNIVTCNLQFSFDISYVLEYDECLLFRFNSGIKTKIFATGTHLNKKQSIRFPIKTGSKNQVRLWNRSLRFQN